MPKPVYARDKNKNRWHLPQDPQPPDLRCLRVWIPDDPEYLARFQGHYLALARQIHWHRDSAHTAKTVAATWLRAYDETFIELEDCGLDFPTDEGDCRRFMMDAPFYKFAPNDPFGLESVPPPYNTAPWKVASGATTLIPGLEEGDVYTDWTVIAGTLGANIFEWIQALLGNIGLPRMEITLHGEGEIEFVFIGMPQGGYAYITVDGNALNADWIDLSTISIEDFDTVQEAIGNALGTIATGNLFKTINYEKTITGTGEHTISVTMMPAINIPDELIDVINLVSFGGGIRSVTICGFTQEPEVPQPQIQLNGDNLEWRPNDIAAWIDLGVVVGADGTDGADGADGADGMNGADGADGMNGADGADGMNAPVPIVTISEPSAGNHLIEFDMDANGTPENAVLISDGEDGASGGESNFQPAYIGDYSKICGILDGITRHWLTFFFEGFASWSSVFFGGNPIPNGPALYFADYWAGHQAAYIGTSSLSATAYRLWLWESPRLEGGVASMIDAWMNSATNQEMLRDFWALQITVPLTVDSFRAANQALYDDGLPMVSEDITIVLAQIFLLMSDWDMEVMFANYILWESEDCPDFGLLLGEPAGTEIRVPGDDGFCNSAANGYGLIVDSVLESTGDTEKQAFYASIEFVSAYTGTITLTFNYGGATDQELSLLCLTRSGTSAAWELSPFDETKTTQEITVTACTKIHFSVQSLDHDTVDAEPFTVTAINFT